MKTSSGDISPLLYRKNNFDIFNVNDLKKCNKIKACDLFNLKRKINLLNVITAINIAFFLIYRDTQKKSDTHFIILMNISLLSINCNYY